MTMPKKSAPKNSRKVPVKEEPVEVIEAVEPEEELKAFEPMGLDEEEPSVARAPLKTAEEITVEDIFGTGGLLETRHPGFEFRASQLAMAEVVDEAFQRHQHAIIEAGTGTGKTLAYLIPAIRSGRRVVISTATKSLQEQLFKKDVPFLQKYFAPKLKAALMKGRNEFSVPRRKCIRWTASRC